MIQVVKHPPDESYKGNHRYFKCNIPGLDRLVLQGSKTGVNYVFYPDSVTKVINVDANDFAVITRKRGGCCGHSKNEIITVLKEVDWSEVKNI